MSEPCHMAATSLFKKTSLYPGETNYLYLLTHHHHLHHHLTKGNLEEEGERHEAERRQHMEMRPDEATDATVGSSEEGFGWHVGDIPLPAALPLWGEQPGAFQKEKSNTNLPVLCHHRAGSVPTTFQCAKSSSPKGEQGSSKRGGFFLQNKLSPAFFPLAFTLRDFLFHQVSNWQVSISNSLCTLLTQYIAATSSRVNSLLNDSTKAFKTSPWNWTSL